MDKRKKFAKALNEGLLILVSETPADENGDYTMVWKHKVTEEVFVTHRNIN